MEQQESKKKFGISKIKFDDFNSGVGVSDVKYNLLIGGMVLYGLIVNLVMCLTCTQFAMSINPIVFFVGYLALVFVGTSLIYKSQSNVVRFIGYNLIVVPLGLVISIAVQTYGGLGSQVVTQAFVYTIIITAVMVMLSIAFPQFFSKIGFMLFGCLIGMLIAFLIVMLLGMNTIVISYFGAVLFSLYIGYDFWKAQQLPHTVGNAIASACDIYVDIVNLFMFLLEIFGDSSSSK